MSDTRTQTPCELQFLLDALYDINDDAEFAGYDDCGEEEPWFDEDLAYARYREGLSERGSWFGRDPEGY